MEVAPIPVEECVRLMDLARYEVLDTGREAVFDRVTRLAARLLHVPMAAIHFLDQDRVWSKSAQGLPPDEMPRDAAFCSWTILQDEPLIVPDLSADRRFAGHPSVRAGGKMRMYAGAPLQTPAGHRIGTLCVLDTVPHPLTPDDVQALQDLAATAMSELELRRQLLQTGRDLEAQQDRLAELQRTLDHAQTLEAVSLLMDLPLEPDEVAMQAAALIGQAIQADWAGIACYRGGAPFTRRAFNRAGLHPDLLDMASHVNSAERSVTHTLQGLREPLYIARYHDHPAALPAMVAAGLQSVAFVPLGEWKDLVVHLLLFRADGARRQPWRDSDRSLLEAAARSVRASLHRRAALEATAQLARTDPLTGALNRRAFDEDLSEQLQAGADFTVMMIDLDGFKALNDSEGHAQGDKVLRVFAGVLQAELPMSRVYRLGGDEFVVLLGERHSADEAEDGVDLAVLAVQQLNLSRLGASVGFARQAEATPEQDVVRLADARMYAAKRSRNAHRAASRMDAAT